MGERWLGSECLASEMFSYIFLCHLFLPKLDKMTYQRLREVSYWNDGLYELPLLVHKNWPRRCSYESIRIHATWLRANKIPCFCGQQRRNPRNRNCHYFQKTYCKNISQINYIKVTYSGKIFSFKRSDARVYAFPYIKTLRPVEWPWKSQKKNISLDSCVFFIINLVW